MHTSCVHNDVLVPEAELLDLFLPAQPPQTAPPLRSCWIHQSSPTPPSEPGLCRCSHRTSGQRQREQMFRWSLQDGPETWSHWLTPQLHSSRLKTVTAVVRVLHHSRLEVGVQKQDDTCTLTKQAERERLTCLQPTLELFPTSMALHRAAAPGWLRCPITGPRKPPLTQTRADWRMDSACVCVHNWIWVTVWGSEASFCAPPGVY